MNGTAGAVDFEDLRQARERIGSWVHQTPVAICAALDELLGCKLFFKCENLQKVGAFKARGAVNAVMSLPEDVAQRGVATHSSGNHAAALSFAGKLRGIPVHIVMPSNSPGVKKAAVEHYGGRITICEPTLESRESTAARIVEETGAELIHPFNDFRVIAGQGTAAMELLEQAPDLDAVLAPVGGGGLLSGTAIAVKSLNPGIRVIGCEPFLADDAFRSFRAGVIQPVLRTDTIGDGLRTSLGDRTFPIIRRLVDDIALASEEAIVRSTRLLLERAKMVVEPSGAVGLAVLLENGPRKLAPTSDREPRIGVILSGGNLDLRGFCGILASYPNA